MTENLETLGYSPQQWRCFVGNVISFGLLLVWPAIKTLACLIDAKESGVPKRGIGRWAAYWIGLPFVYIVYEVLSIIIGWWTPWPLIQVVAAFILSSKNGELIHKLTYNVILEQYKENYEELKKLPKTLEKLSGSVFAKLFSMIMKNKAKEE